MKEKLVVMSDLQDVGQKLKTYVSRGYCRKKQVDCFGRQADLLSIPCKTEESSFHIK